MPNYEFITVKNPSHTTMSAIYRNVRYVCKPHAQIEIPARMFWMFKDQGAERLGNRLMDGDEETILGPVPGNLQERSSDIVLCDDTIGNHYVTPDAYGLVNVPDEIARQWARDDWDGIMRASVSKRDYYNPQCSAPAGEMR